MSLIDQIKAGFATLTAAVNKKAPSLTPVMLTGAPTTPTALNYYQITPTAPVTFALPTSQPNQQIGVMQLAANPTVNTITFTGTINGIANSGITLSIYNEAKILTADGSGGWSVLSSNYGKAGLDQRYLRGMTSRINETANFTAAPQTEYMISAAAGAVTVTLPSTNTASDLIYIVKSDASANLVSYTGTVNGTASFTGSVRTQNQGKLFQGDGTGNWNIIGGDVSVSALDARYPRQPGFVPPVGYWGPPDKILGSTGGTMIWQRLNFTPFEVGPQGWTADAFGLVVSTAFTGGSAANLLIGIYGDDGTGFPNMVGGPLRTATLSLASLATGTQTLLFSGGTYALAPGRYWIATLATGTTAPTAGGMQCLTNTSWNLGIRQNFAPNTPVRGYVFATQTALPTTQLAVSGMTISGNNDIPLVVLRRSA